MAFADSKLFCSASALSFPYELTAKTRPPLVTSRPSLRAVPLWNTMLSATFSMPSMG